MKYYIILYASMLLSAGAQIMLKLGATNSNLRPGFRGKFFNPMLLLGLSAMVTSMLMNVKGLRYVPLKDMTFILPTIYIMVPVFAWIFLRERPGNKTLIGSAIMLLGIIVFNLPI